MMSESGVSGIFSFAELRYLRMEAMDLFERCLTEGDPKLLEGFVERQISQEPPRLELLREVAEDLHQRLLDLYSSRYEVREQVLQILRDEFGVAAKELLPVNSMKSDQPFYLDDALTMLRQKNGTLTEADELLLHKKLDAPLTLEAQMHRDVLMTEYLYAYVMDWVMGLNAIFTRRYWAASRYAPLSDWTH
jgi:hypothetical protein